MVPNPTESVAFIAALIKNAQDLLADAKVLLEHDRHARAFVLSILAREEAGKALLVLANAMGDPDIQSWQLSSHREKLSSAAAADLFLLGELPQVFEGVQRLESESANREKMAGLYVDRRDGELRTPDRIEPARAAEAYAGASALLDRLEPILGSLTPDALSFAQLFDQELGRVLDQYVETAGTTAAAELARRIIEWGTGQVAASVEMKEAAPPTRHGSESDSANCDPSQVAADAGERGRPGAALW